MYQVSLSLLPDNSFQFSFWEFSSPTCRTRDSDQPDYCSSSEGVTRIRLEGSLCSILLAMVTGTGMSSWLKLSWPILMLGLQLEVLEQSVHFTWRWPVAFLLEAMKINSTKTNFLKLNFPNETSLYAASTNLSKSYVF